MKSEEWRIVTKYPNYKVSNLGRVKSLQRERIIGDNKYIQKERLLKKPIDAKGYHYVRLYNERGFKNIKIHRLVAEAFLDNPNNYPCVNHIDSNRTNNVVTNLEWCTYKQNMEHAVKNHRFDNMAKINSERMKRNKPVLKRWVKLKNSI